MGVNITKLTQWQFNKLYGLVPVSGSSNVAVLEKPVVGFLEGSTTSDTEVVVVSPLFRIPTLRKLIKSLCVTFYVTAKVDSGSGEITKIEADFELGGTTVQTKTVSWTRTVTETSYTTYSLINVEFNNIATNGTDTEAIRIKVYGHGDGTNTLSVKVMANQDYPLVFSALCKILE